ncbi:mitochondrial dynamin family protein [Andalucia godoyi]|uniref:Mitochondrial dynamin family protein n=1 Tax=Andalucia godoyi TaxID=505711 RepID=A0A8K0AGV2_ANDGO|nr:mitochondrial dynamin family protein [Andalucia godoyi]|eukprot:ANDGO_07811.mRNA.1 mitochondrial dynamin family protein (Drp1/Dnm1p ortholog)
MSSNVDVPFSSVLTIVNRLSDVFQSLSLFESIDLPQIAVVGSQSSGKSSVLESLVGKGFLPRGSGIVTRRPTVLQLIHEPPGTAAATAPVEYAEFVHLPNQRFTDWDAVRIEIERETARVAGSGKGVSPSPITLRIHSPYVLNLTLVDLPGLIKIPVGDQPQNIESIVRDLVLKFIARPSTIILAVTPANMDLANSDAIQIARQVDPEGTRTLGVLTKLDLMDKGTDAADILRNNLLPLRLGYVGVVCRSQADLDAKTPLAVSRARENSFFANHPAYQDLYLQQQQLQTASSSQFVDSAAAGWLGTEVLGKRLQTLLMGHIRQHLPGVKQRLQTMLTTAQKQLSVLGSSPLDAVAVSASAGGAGAGAGAYGPVVLDAMTRFATLVRETIEGRLASSDATNSRLTGGARISHLFHGVFAPCLLALDPLDSLTATEVRAVVRNAKGARSTVFVPESAFEILIRQQIARLERPAQQCVDLVLDELAAMCEHCEGIAGVARFPALRQKIRGAAAEVLRDRAVPCRAHVASLVQCEWAYINTAHPDFSIENMPMQIAQQQTNQNISQLGFVPPPVPVPVHHLHHQQQQQQLQQLQQLQSLQPQQPQQSLPLQQQQQSASQAPSTNSASQQQESLLDRFFGKKTVPTTTTSASRTHSHAHSQSSQSSHPQSQQQQQHSQNMLQSPMLSHDEFERAVLDASEDPWTSQERAEVSLIRSMMSSYFAIVRKNIMDSVPKAIMHFLVNHIRDNLQTELVARVYREQDFPELLREAPDVEERRSRAHRTVIACQKGLQLINEVRDSRF